MKIEIEILEDDIRSALDKKVKDIINNQVLRHDTESYIKESVGNQLKIEINNLILEALKESDILREKIALQIQNKIKNQLASAMKLTSASSAL